MPGTFGGFRVTSGRWERGNDEEAMHFIVVFCTPCSSLNRRGLCRATPLGSLQLLPGHQRRRSRSGSAFPNFLQRCRTLKRLATGNIAVLVESHPQTMRNVVYIKVCLPTLARSRPAAPPLPRVPTARPQPETPHTALTSSRLLLQPHRRGGSGMQTSELRVSPWNSPPVISSAT